MNVLMMSLFYPDECYEEVASLSRCGMQNQINNYQKAFIEGISADLSETEALAVLNALPVGIYPLQYKKLWLKDADYENGRIHQLGGLNLPVCKQQMRFIRAAKALKRWVEASPNNRTVLVYTQYLPYLKAIIKVKQKHPDLKAAVIVTDLPNEYGLSSGRTGVLKKLERRMGEKQLLLLKRMDAFVLLTKHMAEVIPCECKPTLVIEGLVQQREAAKAQTPADDQKPFEVLYTGTLSPELGIREMLEAFADMPEYHLRICGGGVMAEDTKTFAEKHENIHFEGFVPQQKALAMQAEANALINPRSPSGVFTRYSFPSKTLEYMRSGKPVLCYKLEGIPDDYDEHLCYIRKEGPQGIQEAVRSLAAMSSRERSAIGENARSYVLTHKNPFAQCKILVQWLRSL